MIETPGILLRAHEATEWSSEGPLAERALVFARQFLNSLRQDDPARNWNPRRLVIEQSAPEHAGLGTGTQLGLAVAGVLARSFDLNAGPVELARRIGRGARSALGLHGFEMGGLLVDGGKVGAGSAPLLARLPFPEAWRLVLVLPGGVGLHGSGEQQAFARLAGRLSVSATETLCRLVLLGMLPALAEGDLDAFGEALFDFNARVGEAFAAEQGGTYSGPAVADVVGRLRAGGVKGVAQSSWGPTVCAVVEDEEHAAHLARRTAAQLGSDTTVWVSRGMNEGARIEES
jgi:beta-RFAP synthase